MAVSQESTKPIRCECNRSQCDEVAFWPWLKKVPKILRDRHLGWGGSSIRRKLQSGTDGTGKPNSDYAMLGQELQAR